MSRLTPETLDTSKPHHRVFLALVAYSDESGRVQYLTQTRLAALTLLSKSDVSIALKALTWDEHIELHVEQGLNLYSLRYSRETFRMAAFSWRLDAEERVQKEEEVAADELLTEKQRQKERRAEQEAVWDQQRREREERDRERYRVSDAEYRFILALVYWANDKLWVDGPRIGELATQSGLSFEDAAAALRGLEQRQLVRKMTSYSSVERNRYQLLFAVDEELRRKARAQFSTVDAELAGVRQARNTFGNMSEEERKIFIMDRLQEREVDGVVALRRQQHVEFGTVSDRQLFRFLYALEADGMLSLLPKDPLDPDIIRMRLFI